MSQLKVGQYWYAEASEGFPFMGGAEKHDRGYWECQQWLFLLVATSTKGRKRYWLGQKCYPKNGVPIVDDDGQGYWFTGDGENPDKDWFVLTEQCPRRSGKRFLT